MEGMSQEQVGEAMADIVTAMEQVPAQPAQAAEPQVEGADAEVETEHQAQEQAQEPETLEIDPDDPLFDQELDEDGKKVTKKLSLRELQQGYLRTADYTRKTMDLAKQRAEVQESVRQAQQESAKQYAAKLDAMRDALVKTIEPEFTGVDLRRLASEDPFKWATLKQRMEDVNSTLQAIDKEKAELTDRQQQEEQKAKSEKWAKTVEQLRVEIPDWGQPVVAQLAKAARDAGATDAQVNSIDEAWIIKLAHKAAQFDQLQSAKTEVKKVAIVPKVLKPGQKQAPTKPDEHLKNWRKSGGKLNSDGAEIFAKFV